MTEALLRAKNSQIIEPAFIKKLAALKDNLDMVAAATKRYTENNKEHGTMDPKRHAMAQMHEAAK